MNLGECSSIEMVDLKECSFWTGNDCTGDLLRVNRGVLGDTKVTVDLKSNVQSDQIKLPLGVELSDFHGVSICISTAMIAKLIT